MPLFSKRHQRAIFDKRLKVSIPRRLRGRIWKILEHHDHGVWIQRDPTDRWTTQSSVLTEVQSDLKREYGVDTLEAFNQSDERVPVELKEFVLGAYPSQVLDVVEATVGWLHDKVHDDFVHEINQAFREEGCPWRLANGQFLQVDSEFLSLEVAARAEQLLTAHGFEGALAEFVEARNDLSAGDIKGAIHNACKSLESTIKVILARDGGNASELIRGLPDTGIYGHVPSGVERSFGDSVLMALPYLRNRLGGHGQGDEVIDVPKEYGELAVHLAGAFILFLVERQLMVKEDDGGDHLDEDLDLLDIEEIPF